MIQNVPTTIYSYWLFFQISPFVKQKFNFCHCNLLVSESTCLLRYPFACHYWSMAPTPATCCLSCQHRIKNVLVYHSSSNSTFTTMSLLHSQLQATTLLFKLLLSFKHLVQILHTTRYRKGHGENSKKPTTPLIKTSDNLRKLRRGSFRTRARAAFEPDRATGHRGDNCFSQCAML
jgi:hypothetical protein